MQGERPRTRRSARGKTVRTMVWLTVLGLSIAGTIGRTSLARGTRPFFKEGALFESVNTIDEVNGSHLAMVENRPHERKELSEPAATAEDPFEEDQGDVKEISDPLETWNRWMFTFNDRLYFWALKPLAKGYRFIVPLGGRIAIRNFFHNLAMPIRFISALLQGKPKVAGYELCRFLINSSVGLAGFADVARQEPELRIPDEDMGQTFAVWGLDHGLYIVWPLLGPSSLRDSLGTLVDRFLSPLTYVAWYLLDPEVTYGISALRITNDTSLRIGEYEDMKESAVDPYIALRNAYYQHRRSEVEK